RPRPRPRLRPLDCVRLLGVAGGEYRIPALIFLFGVPTVFAGTISSLASIPVQLTGWLEHRKLGHGGPTTFSLGAVMGIASLIGVALGVVFLGRSTQALVTQILGVAMVLAAIRIVWDIRHPHPSEVLGRRSGPEIKTRTINRELG